MTGTATNCRFCSNPLPEKRRPNRVYCNEECARQAMKLAWHMQNPKSALSQFATGTIAEVNTMRVCINLLERGYSVYRAAFPAMPFDIMAGPAFDHWQRVKVTSGSRTTKGTLVHPVKDARRSEFDVLAVVTGDGIFYEPEL